MVRPSPRGTLRAAALLLPVVVVGVGLPGSPAEDPTPESVSVSGSLLQLSDEPGWNGGGGTLLAVPGSGLLRVDLETESPAAAAVTVEVTVPPGLALPSEPSARLAALAAASADSPIAARVVSSARRDPAASISRTPNSGAPHQVFAVLVSPSRGPAAPEQSATRAAAAVEFADAYWADQSQGSISFELEGVVPWYASSADCGTAAGSYALWAEAATRAAPLGYRAAPGQHLALILPPAASCGAIGLGTVGTAVGAGGVLWIRGTTAAQDPGARLERSTLAHELGHNMSLGHADWLDCQVSQPNYGGIPGAPGSGCVVRGYGDLVDVMGFSSYGRDAGALSSVHGIRASIWPESAWTAAPSGSTSYRLAPVTADSGLRAVTVVDGGVTYFVEYRSFADEDAPFASVGCGPTVSKTACVATAPGVRILRLDGDPRTGILARPGTDSMVLGVAGSGRIALRSGESWSSRPGGGVSVAVRELGPAGATIEVRRGAPVASVAGSVRLDVTVSGGAPGTVGVGDTVTAFLGDEWVADDFLFEWTRDGEPIDAPSSVGSRVVTSDDVGHALRVVVVGRTAAGESEPVVSAPRYVGATADSAYAGPGVVAIEATPAGLAAATRGWPDGTRFEYRWTRVSTPGSAGSPIPGAVGSTYAPTAADAGVGIRVRVTARVPGFAAPTLRAASVADVALRATGTLALSGSATVGGAVRVRDDRVFSTGAAPSVAATHRVEWLRDGAPIPGAVGESYLPTLADLGRALTARVTSSSAAAAGVVAATTPAVRIAPGSLPGGRALPTVSAAPSRVLTAVPAAEGPERTGVTLSYAWQRDGRAIAGATGRTLTLRAGDSGRGITVVVRYSRPGFATVALESLPADLALRAAAAPTIEGAARVRSVLAVTLPEFVTGSPATTVVPERTSIQWLRNGVAIRGATRATYRLTAADAGARISVSVTATAPGLLPATARSVASAKVAR